MSEMTFGVRWYVYQQLTGEFAFDEHIDLATVGSKLRQRGIRFEDYGYGKLRPFLEDLGDFVELATYENNGTQVAMVLHRVDDWNALRDADAAQARRDADALAPQVVVPESFQTQWAADLVAAGLYDERSIPADLLGFLTGGRAEEFAEFCHVPQALNERLVAIAPENMGVAELLGHDWFAVRSEHAWRYEDGAVVWPLHMLDANKQVAVELAMAPNPEAANNDWYRPWILREVDVVERRRRDDVPTAEIDGFARIDWPSFLSELARTARPEPWDFEGASGAAAAGPLSILRSYIALTYFRLKLEDKICFSSGNTFAAFNTGLATSRFDDIYAAFEKTAASRVWQPCGFCTAGSAGLGKKIARLFSPLPQRASYFAKKEDLLYDTEKDLVVDYTHILVDNVDRLPLNFLVDETGGFAGASKAVSALRAAAEGGRQVGRHCDELEALRGAISSDDRLFRRLRCRLDDTIAMALRRQRLDWRTATPSYHPRLNRMSFLLPLDFLDDGVVDNALVVSVATPSKNYLGETIFTMPQAYSNARLVGMPSGWLVPTAVTTALDKNLFLA